MSDFKPQIAIFHVNDRPMLMLYGLNIAEDNRAEEAEIVVGLDDVPDLIYELKRAKMTIEQLGM